MLKKEVGVNMCVRKQGNNIAYLLAFIFEKIDEHNFAIILMYLTVSTWNKIVDSYESDKWLLIICYVKILIKVVAQNCDQKKILVNLLARHRMCALYGDAPDF